MNDDSLSIGEIAAEQLQKNRRINATTPFCPRAPSAPDAHSKSNNNKSINNHNQLTIIVIWSIFLVFFSDVLHGGSNSEPGSKSLRALFGQQSEKGQMERGRRSGGTDTEKGRGSAIQRWPGHTRTHAQTRARAHTHARTSTHTNTHTCRRTHARIHMHTHICTRTQARTRTRTHTIEKNNTLMRVAPAE